VKKQQMRLAELALEAAAFMDANTLHRSSIHLVVIHPAQLLSFASFRKSHHRYESQAEGRCPHGKCPAWEMPC
jgi:hypothetical protein